jgi:hypothetical protein
MVVLLRNHIIPWWRSCDDTPHDVCAQTLSVVVPELSIPHDESLLDRGHHDVGARKFPQNSENFFEQPCARLRPRPFRSRSCLELHGSFRWRKRRGELAREATRVARWKIALTVCQLDMATLTHTRCAETSQRSTCANQTSSAGPAVCYFITHNAETAPLRRGSSCRLAGREILKRFQPLVCLPQPSTS